MRMRVSQPRFSSCSCYLLEFGLLQSSVTNLLARHAVQANPFTSHPETRQKETQERAAVKLSPGTAPPVIQPSISEAAT